MANILCYIGKGPSQCPIIQVPDIHFTLKRLDDRINSKREAKGSKWVALLDSCLRKDSVVTNEERGRFAVRCPDKRINFWTSPVYFVEHLFSMNGVEGIAYVSLL